MSLELKNEATVLAAVRLFLRAGHADGESREAMATLIAETSQVPLTHLDVWERMLRAEFWKAENERPSTWRFWKKPPAFASWLDLCSANGFRRERALRSSLGGAPNAFFLSLAVRRLNDWVPQVRLAAKERVPQIAALSGPDVVVEVLWNQLPHWTSWGRLEDADRQVLIDLISQDGVAEALTHRLTTSASGPASTILTQAGRGNALDESLRDIVRDAIQPSLRARAYRCLLEGRMTWIAGYKWTWTDKRWCKGRVEPVLGERCLEAHQSVRDILRSALKDPSPLVRRIAADQLMLNKEAVGAELTVLAHSLATDPAPYVAERGRFILSGAGLYNGDTTASAS